MSVERPEKSSEQETDYQAQNWQNWDRRLTHSEYMEIVSRMAGLHHSGAFENDPVGRQAMYAAEALIRELDILLPNNPFLEEA